MVRISLKTVISIIFVSFLFSCNLNSIKYKYIVDKKEYGLFIKKAIVDITPRVSKKDYSYPAFIKMQNFEPTIRNAFLVACFLGDLSLIKKLLPQTDGMQYKDDEKYLPIVYAIFSKNVDAVRYLSRFMSPDSMMAKNDFNSNLLQIAAAVGDIKIFEMLLDLNLFDLKYLNYSHDTALHLAAYYGNIDVMKKIISLSDSKVLKQKNMFGYTPFLYSFFSHNINAIDYLFLASEQGALDDKNMYKDSVFIVACKTGNLDVINYAINTLRIDNINYQNMYGQSAPMILAAQGNDDAFSLILTKDIDLSLKDIDGNDINYYASITKNKIIKSMIASL